MADQISAHIAPDTRRLLDAWRERSGLSLRHIVESALHQYLAAVAEVPPDMIIPTRLVVTRASFDAAMSSGEGEPSQALEEMLDGTGDPSDPPF